MNGHVSNRKLFLLSLIQYFVIARFNIYIVIRHRFDIQYARYVKYRSLRRYLNNTIQRIERDIRLMNSGEQLEKELELFYQYCSEIRNLFETRYK